jgi:hypothetical protein
VTIFVSYDGSVRAQYPSIQAAIDACRPDGKIIIEEGVYTENICVNRSSKIIGAGADKTIIDGGRVGSVFTLGNESTGIDVVISGMTIKGGIGTLVTVDHNDATKYICGGGILNYGRLTINDVIIKENVANFGGGIFNKGTLNLNEGTLLIHNTAYNGGGIYNSIGSRNIATVNLNQGSSIVNNQATELGAGIYSGGCYPRHGILNIHQGSKISENVAGNSGGGIWIFEGILKMQGGDISNNKGWTGGGIYCYGGNNCLNGGSIENNAAMNGGGVVNGGGSLILDGVTIRGNTASKNDYGYGGGIQNSGIMILKNGSVDHNTACTKGGGVWCNDPQKVSGNRQIVHDNIPDDISP